MQTVSIVGIGRLGGALALALASKDYEIENLFVRNDVTARELVALIEPKPSIELLENCREISTDIVIIAAQDFQIAGITAELSTKIGEFKPFVFHTSGSLSSEILADLSDKDCAVGSIHPLVSVSDAVLGVERFENAYFCVEGDPAAVETAQKIVTDLGGKYFSIKPKFKTLYHAAAVMSAGHLTALIDAAIETLEKCGLSEAQARQTLLPLVKSTVENLETQTSVEALTGTFARADIQTFESHLASLRENVSEEIQEIYLDLGGRATRIAEKKGVDSVNLREIRKQISLAKKNLKC